MVIDTTVDTSLDEFSFVHFVAFNTGTLYPTVYAHQILPYSLCTSNYIMIIAALVKSGAPEQIEVDKVHTVRASTEYCRCAINCLSLFSS